MKNVEPKRTPLSSSDTYSTIDIQKYHDTNSPPRIVQSESQQSAFDVPYEVEKHFDEDVEGSLEVCRHGRFVVGPVERLADETNLFICDYNQNVTRLRGQSIDMQI
jgi:hypothetical protein